MKLRPERLTELLEEVAHEGLSLRTGSPSDAEIGRAKLADLAASYIPELVHEVQRLTATTPAPLADAELAELVALQLPCELQLEESLDDTADIVGVYEGGTTEWVAGRMSAKKAHSIVGIVNALPGLLARVAAAEAPKWVTPAPALSQPSNLPKQDEKVLLELKSGNFAVGQLTWAYRWLLQGGAVLLLQDVVRWQPIVGATVKGGQPDATHN